MMLASFEQEPTPAKYECQAQKFGCHVTSQYQGLRRSTGSGDEDPENQAVALQVLNCSS